MAKILVVEDEKVLLDDIVDLLEMEDHTVYASSNGQDGLNQALEVSPDLIISDVKMPFMDGFEMVNHLKKQPKTSDIPVLFLTAKVERSSIRKGMQLGADDYLTKPFTTDELLETIETLLKKQQHIHERYITPLRVMQEAIAHSLPHEFRTPLYGIIASGELLKMYAEGMSREQIKELGQTIHTSGIRLQKVIEKYLLFAQIEIIESSPEKLDKIRRHTTPFPKGTIEPYLEEEARQWDRVINLQINLSHNPTLKIDRHHFAKACSELIQNAFKFSSEGQTIVVQDELIDGQYELSFIDQGPGMTIEEINNIGQHRQFQRDKFEQQGLGLGLTLSAKIADLYGGKLFLIPGEERGLTQKLVLPIASAESISFQ